MGLTEAACKNPIGQECQERAHSDQPHAVDFRASNYRLSLQCKALHISVRTINLNRANISKAVSTPSRQLRLHFALTGHRLTAAPSHFAACSLPLASTSLHSCRHFTVQNHVTYTLVQSEEHQNSVSMVGPDVLKSQYKNLIRS